ncbi:exported hypothetical protein [Pseudomonas sp. IT-P260]
MTKLLVMEFSAALLALYSASSGASGTVTLPRPELMNASTPLPSRICPTKRCARLIGATALVKNNWPTSARVAPPGVCTSGPLTPALTNSRSKVSPLSCWLRAITACWSSMSSFSIRTLPSACSASAFCGLRTVAVTCQPSASRVFTSPRPKPREAPMISACFAWDMTEFLESYGSRIQWTRLTESLLQRSSQHIEPALKRAVDPGAYSRL